SALTLAPVMVTNPMRGSRTSRRSKRETSSLIRSDTRSVRVLTAPPAARPMDVSGASSEVLDLAAQDFAGALALDFPLNRCEGLLQGHSRRRDPDDPECHPLPEVLMVDF